MHNAQLSLGELITTPQDRDAIHIAVIPVVVEDVELIPGQRVGLVPGTANKITAITEDHVGIVDPFLRQPVKRNDRCWLFLLPQTVTGMRHHWEHPRFDRQVYEDRRAESLKWLQEFGQKHHSSNERYEGFAYKGWGGCYSAQQLIDAAEEYLLTGWRHVQQGSESLRDNTPVSEFWYHFEIVTGRRLSPDQKSENPFCCTC